MFAVALDIRLSDFTKIFKNPKAPIVGLISQLMLLPALTLLLVLIFQPPPSMALGMLLVSACPGGNVSNYAVHLSGANSALSVMLTSITTLSSIIITPLLFLLLSSLLPLTAEMSQTISVDPFQMFQVIVTLIFIPLVIGMYLRRNYNDFVEKIGKGVRTLSMVIFVGFVIAAIAANWTNIVDHLGKVFLIVVVHNAVAFSTGYFFAKANKLSEYNSRAISIETGIQNSGLALILIFNFFEGLGGMAIIAACWGIWHLISGFCLAMFWSRSKVEHSS